MPGEIAQAFVRIRPNTTGFKAETESQVKKSMLGIGKLTTVAIGVTGTAELVKKVAEASATQQAQLALVRRAVDNTNSAWVVHGKTVDQTLIGISRATGLSTSSVLTSFARAQIATKDTSKSFLLIRDAADLSRLSHKSLEASTLTLQRALQGSTNSLRRFGIVIAPITTAQDALTKAHDKAVASGYKFTSAQNAVFKAQLDQAKATDKQASQLNVLTQVHERAGGAAATFAKTASGQYARLGVSLHELAVQVGDDVLPMLTHAAAGATKFIDSLGKSKTLHTDMNTLGSVVKTTFGAIAETAKVVGPPIEAIAKAVSEVTSSIGGGGLIAIAVGFKTIGTATAVAARAQASYNAVVLLGRGEATSYAAAKTKLASASEAEATAANMATAAQERSISTYRTGTTVQAAAAAEQAAMVAKKRAGLLLVTPSPRAIGGGMVQSAETGRTVTSVNKLTAAIAQQEAALAANVETQTIWIGQLGVMSKAAAAGGVAIQDMNGVIVASSVEVEAALATETAATTGLGTVSRGVFTAMGGWMTVATVAAAGLAYGIYRLVTAESEQEKQTKRLITAQQQLASEEQRHLDIARKVTDLRRQIPEDRNQVAQARDAALSAVENAKAAKGTANYKSAVDSMIGSLLNWKRAQQTLHDDQKALDSSQANLASSTRKQSRDQADAVREAIKTANAAREAATQRRFGIRIPSLDPALEAANQVKAFRDSMLKAANDPDLKNAGIRRADTLLAAFAQRFKRLPTTAEIKVILSNRSVHETIAGLARQLPQTGLAFTSGHKLGTSYTQGIAAGMTDGTTIVNTSVENLIKGATEAGRQASKSRSPSEVAREQIGHPFAEGIILGLQDRTSHLMGAVTELIDGAMTSGRSRASRRFSSGGARPAASRFETGGIVPGEGDRDTVPAMLTPGEVVLNKSQQQIVLHKLGTNEYGPDALFKAANTRTSFAKGGSVDYPCPPGRGPMGFAGGGHVQHFLGGGPVLGRKSHGIDLSGLARSALRGIVSGIRYVNAPKHPDLSAFPGATGESGSPVFLSGIANLLGGITAVKQVPEMHKAAQELAHGKRSPLSALLAGAIGLPFGKVTKERSGDLVPGEDVFVKTKSKEAIAKIVHASDEYYRSYGEKEYVQQKEKPFIAAQKKARLFSDPEEEPAVDAYTSQGSTSMKNVMRLAAEGTPAARKKLQKLLLDRREYDDDDTLKLSKILSGSLGKARLAEDLVSFRTVDAEELKGHLPGITAAELTLLRKLGSYSYDPVSMKKAQELAQTLTHRYAGKPITVHDFMSTSLDPETAEGFADFEMVIRAHKGDQAGYISYGRPHGPPTWHGGSEWEFIFNAGQRMKMSGIELVTELDAEQRRDVSTPIPTWLKNSMLKLGAHEISVPEAKSRSAFVPSGITQAYAVPHGTLVKHGSGWHLYDDAAKPQLRPTGMRLHFETLPRTATDAGRVRKQVGVLSAVEKEALAGKVRFIDMKAGDIVSPPGSSHKYEIVQPPVDQWDEALALPAGFENMLRPEWASDMSYEDWKHENSVQLDFGDSPFWDLHASAGKKTGTAKKTTPKTGAAKKTTPKTGAASTSLFDDIHDDLTFDEIADQLAANEKEFHGPSFLAANAKPEQVKVPMSSLKKGDVIKLPSGHGPFRVLSYDEALNTVRIIPDQMPPSVKAKDAAAWKAANTTHYKGSYSGDLSLVTKYPKVTKASLNAETAAKAGTAKSAAAKASVPAHALYKGDVFSFAGLKGKFQEGKFQVGTHYEHDIEIFPYPKPKKMTPAEMTKWEDAHVQYMPYDEEVVKHSKPTTAAKAKSAVAKPTASAKNTPVQVPSASLKKGDIIKYPGYQSKWKVFAVNPGLDEIQVVEHPLPKMDAVSKQFYTPSEWLYENMDTLSIESNPKITKYVTEATAAKMAAAADAKKLAAAKAKAETVTSKVAESSLKKGDIIKLPGDPNQYRVEYRDDLGMDISPHPLPPKPHYLTTQEWRDKLTDHIPAKSNQKVTKFAKKAAAKPGTAKTATTGTALNAPGSTIYATASAVKKGDVIKVSGKKGMWKARTGYKKNTSTIELAPHPLPPMTQKAKAEGLTEQEWLDRNTSNVFYSPSSSVLKLYGSSAEPTKTAKKGPGVQNFQDGGTAEAVMPWWRGGMGYQHGGVGPTDTVPAMLTPGEVVLNRDQQARLGKRLGIGAVKPEALFNRIKGFQRGGVTPGIGPHDTIIDINPPGPLLQGVVGTSAIVALIRGALTKARQDRAREAAKAQSTQDEKEWQAFIHDLLFGGFDKKKKTSSFKLPGPAARAAALDYAQTNFASVAPPPTAKAQHYGVVDAATVAGTREWYKKATAAIEKAARAGVGKGEIIRATDSVTSSMQGFADAVKQGTQAFVDSVTSAKQNLNQLGASLANDINSFLQKKAETGSGGIPSTVATQVAHLMGEVRAGHGGELNARFAQSTIDQLSAAQTIKAAQSATGTDKADQITRSIADITDLFNRGSITQQTASSRVSRILRRENVSASGIQSKLGVAAADQFRADLSAVGLQMGAIRAAPSVPGTGLLPTIIKPLDTLRQEQRNIADAAKSQRDTMIQAQSQANHLLKQIAANTKKAQQKDKALPAALQRALERQYERQLKDAGISPAMIAALLGGAKVGG